MAAGTRRTGTGTPSSRPSASTGKAGGDMTRIPDFFFQRRRDIELEEGFTLAGTLMIDIPKCAIGKLKARDRRMIGYTVGQILKVVEDGEMPDDVDMISPNDQDRPSSPEALAAWTRDRVIIEVEVDGDDIRFVHTNKGVIPVKKAGRHGH
jgi:hypothetical protein